MIILYYLNLRFATLNSVTDLLDPYITGDQSVQCIIAGYFDVSINNYSSHDGNFQSKHQSGRSH